MASLNRPGGRPHGLLVGGYEAVRKMQAYWVSQFRGLLTALPQQPTRRPRRRLMYILLAILMVTPTGTAPQYSATWRVGQFDSLSKCDARGIELSQQRQDIVDFLCVRSVANEAQRPRPRRATVPLQKPQPQPQPIAVPAY